MSKRMTYYIGIFLILAVAVVLYFNSVFLIALIVALGAVFLGYLVGKFTRQAESDHSFELHFWRKKHAAMAKELASYRRQSTLLSKPLSSEEITNSEQREPPVNDEGTISS
jgi:hypothetical protein